MLIVITHNHCSVYVCVNMVLFFFGSLSLSTSLSPSLHASLDHSAAYYPMRSPKEIAHNPGINEARPRQQCTRFFRVRGTLEGAVLAVTPIPL